MIARVVTKRDNARLALAATAASALGLAAVIVDDLLGSLLFEPPMVTTYLYVAVLIALGGVGPWLTRTTRGRAMAVRCEAGALQVGEELRIEAGDVTALAIAEGALGQSVAVARGSHIVFLEVERREEARRISEALSVPVTPFGELRLREASRVGAVFQALVAVLAIASAPLYFFASSRGLEPFDAVPGKAIFGIGGVTTSWLGFALLIARRLIPGQAMALGHTAWDAHVTLHRARASDAEIDAARSEDERREHATLRAEEQARAEPIRVANLGRGDEQIGAWLARLDAIPTEQHAYRGDAMKKDVLWETLGDGAAPVDARMAAARLLQRRYGAEAPALLRVVDDHEVRVRVEAALEEHDEAEEHIERLGPLFRAR